MTALNYLFELSGILGGGFTGVIASSYIAEDADIDNAELVYTEWETDLQLQIADVERNHRGYDEYQYNIGDISHNPYELMAYLTVMHQHFNYSDVQAELAAVFAGQYALSFAETTETRGEGENAYTVRILTTTLAARPFNDKLICFANIICFPYLNRELV